MEPTLSIIVPVRNAASELRRRVESILESAADVASHFEILVVDDASEDQTEEVAGELSREYPQVRMIRHRSCQGQQAAVRTGLMRCRGNLVFVHTANHAPSRQELQSLWQFDGNEHLVVGTHKARPMYVQPDLISRLQTWALLVARESDHSWERSDRATRRTTSGHRALTLSPEKDVHPASPAQVH